MGSSPPPAPRKQMRSTPGETNYSNFDCYFEEFWRQVEGSHWGGWNSKKAIEYTIDSIEERFSITVTGKYHDWLPCQVVSRGTLFGVRH